MFGDVLGLGVLEWKGLHDLFLRFFGVEGGHEFLDGLEIRFAGKDDQGTGPAVSRHVDDVFERFPGRFLVEWRQFLGHVFGIDVFQRDHANSHVLGFLSVQHINEILHFS